MDAMLPEMISFKNEKGKLIEQKVTYEWRLTLCTYCKKLWTLGGCLQEEEEN